MGSNDIPPPHVPLHVVPLCNFFLQVGGGLWTVCYILYVRESLRSRSYGMPLFALALNFSWELVYALYVAESPLEKSVFTLWLLIDCGLVYGIVRYARYEWTHSPTVARHIGAIFTVMTAVATLGHWTFARWWIENEIGKKDGKFYRGVVGPDTTELGFWSAILCQCYLSAASLCQLMVRQHSGGVSWAIWSTRTAGSIIGFYLVYGWEWYFWREAHEYVVSPFAVFLWATSFICDFAYPCMLLCVQKTEKVLPDGRKEAGESEISWEAKKSI
ncbi:uncharacterized protein PV07_10389 [Cladophialophora immunda]|uniref:Uncharacterized protein n=1 Tax=Cladophialophora immunda TaxID=569365 RepID=A0A0D2BZZ7_9EURO|nr:uncharacterized protein PV07_10389 [Cladophialophora immunda]KIW24688.1 hypothetical protein PV07_10389 [Cladophialophora immunda]